MNSNIQYFNLKTNNSVKYLLDFDNNKLVTKDIMWKDEIKCKINNNY
jgi:hypothetical protein